MKEKKQRVWREQTRFQSKFTNGRDELTLRGILRTEGDSPNNELSSELEFLGDCESEDGEFVKRKKRYNMTPEIAKHIVEAMDVLERFANDRPPATARERFREVTSGFIVSLKQTPDRTLLVLQHPNDGWKFETEERKELIAAFAEAIG